MNGDTNEAQALAEVLHTTAEVLAAEDAVRRAQWDGDDRGEAAATARLSLWKADLLAAAVPLAAAWSTPRARATAPHFGTNVARELVTAVTTLYDTDPGAADTLREHADQAAAFADLPAGERARVALFSLRSTTPAVMAVLAAAARLYEFHGAPSEARD